MRKIMLAAILVLIAFAAHAEDAAKKKIVFVAGPPSHGFGAHEHNAGCMLLAKALNESGLNVETVVYKNGWPTAADAFDNAAAVIIYCDGGGGHVAIKHLKEVDEMVKKGVGVGCIHYAVEIPAGDPGEALLRWIGGYYLTFWSVNPHWNAEFKELPKHPVTNGVKPFATTDEWYYNMRFTEAMKGVTPILTAVPPDGTRKGRDDAHGGNPFVRENKGRSEHVVWVYEGPTNRGFGCTGGHVHWNWGQDDFRKCILNSIVWIAKMDVPAEGVPSKRPSVDDLIANQDEPVPEKFNKDDIAKQIEAMNAKK